MTAILIHDPNEVFRCSLKVGSVIGHPIWENEQGTLEDFCSMILSDNQGAGK